MIYTSYFANYKNFKNLIPIGIVRFPPKYFTGENWKEFSPSTQLYKEGLINTTFFEKLYRQEMLGKDFSKIKDNMVLLCFERRGEFCHRHILAKILQEQGKEVIELI